MAEPDGPNGVIEYRVEYLQRGDWIAPGAALAYLEAARESMEARKRSGGYPEATEWRIVWREIGPWRPI